MKVSELIEQLQNCDKDKEVKFYSNKKPNDKIAGYVTVDEIAEGKFIEIISKENNGRL